jgi:hypothetical protein
MSWELLVLPVPVGLTSVDDLPDDLGTEPLGSHDDVKTLLRGRLPGIDFSEATWGRLTGPGWSMELDLGSQTPVDSIMLSVRGTGDDVLQAIFEIADSLRCRVIDISEGAFLESDNQNSWQAFQAYRNRTVGGR